jgi:hypothetical protein
VNAQPQDEQTATPQSSATTVTFLERARRLWRRRQRHSAGPAPAVGWEHRLEALEARTEHLELALEGLQDAVHRRAVLEDESIAELRRRTEPDQIARDLSRNARTRGL